MESRPLLLPLFIEVTKVLEVLQYRSLWSSAVAADRAQDPLGSIRLYPYAAVEGIIEDADHEEEVKVVVSVPPPTNTTHKMYGILSLALTRRSTLPSCNSSSSNPWASVRGSASCTPRRSSSRIAPAGTQSPLLQQGPPFLCFRQAGREFPRWRLLYRSSGAPYRVVATHRKKRELNRQAEHHVNGGVDRAGCGGVAFANA